MKIVRVTFVDNVAQHKRCTAVVKLDNDTNLEGLYQVASNKLKCKIKSIYDSSGTLFDLERVQAMENGEILLCSKDEKIQPILSTETVKHAENKVKDDIPIYRIFDHSEVSNKAIEQLNACAIKLSGVEAVAGMPDLHPGTAYPIGSVVATKDVIHPVLIGSDIGCGMMLMSTGISIGKLHKLKSERLMMEFSKPVTPSPHLDKDTVNYLDYLAQTDTRYATDAKQMCHLFTVPGGTNTVDKDAHILYPNDLGTIGGGNHFAEFQRFDKVMNYELFEKYGFDELQLYLLVHSGSRGFGKYVVSQFPGKDISTSASQFTDYMKTHDACVSWARVNRILIAKRALSALSCYTPLQDSEAINKNIKVDLTHNFVSQENGVWLHRKGATPITTSNSDGTSLSVIPGSRGDRTYLVETYARDNGDTDRSLSSIAHGAGRAMPRSECLYRSRKLYPKNSDLATTRMGGEVICDSVATMREEIPEAYKPIENIIHDLRSNGLIKVIATLKPIFTVKM